MRKWLAPLMLILALTACKGGGFGNLNLSSFEEPSAEEKADDKFWDQLYGRKGMDRESKDWKDWYKAPNQDSTKADYCGFWGNCAAEGSRNASSCNFYGNCSKEDNKRGWW